MATKTGTRRYVVERIGVRFVILDIQECSYRECSEGTTRLQAEEQCRVLNEGRRADSKQRCPTSLHREFTGHGVTAEWLSKWFGDRYEGDVQEMQDSLTERQEHLIATYKSWLVPMLFAWSDEVAELCGYGGAKRKTWPTHRIIKMIEEDTFHQIPRTFESLHLQIYPSDRWREWADDSHAMTHKALLSVHYLSPEPTPIKAAFAGMPKSSYMRVIDEAHRLVARRVT